MKGGRVYRNDWDAAAGGDATGPGSDVVGGTGMPGHDDVF